MNVKDIVWWETRICKLCDFPFPVGNTEINHKVICSMCREKAEIEAKEADQSYDDYVDALIVTKEIAGTLPEYQFDCNRIDYYE